MIVPLTNAIFEKDLDIKKFHSLDFKIKIIFSLILLTFKKLKKRFPVIKLKSRLNEFYSTPIIINAVNEILVDQYLRKKIPFNSFYNHILTVMNDRNYKKYAIKIPKNIDQILTIDKWARETTLKKLNIKMLKISFTIMALILFSFKVNAEVINKIEISGNLRVSDETIIIYGEINKNEDYSEQDLNRIINNLYSTNFFEDVKLEIKNNILKVNLVEYPVINNLIILGEPSQKYKEQIIKIMSLKGKDSFIRNYLSSDVEKIKKLYASIGYNFTEVETKIRELDKNNVDLIFEIKRGDITTISKISFIGDKKIREKRLRDVIASQEDKFWKFISKNTRYSKNLINLDLRLLRNYYKSIGYYDVRVTSNTAEIKGSGNVELTYSIDAGKRYTIKKISTIVDPVFDKNLFFPLNETYKKYAGTYYSPFKIKKLLEELDELIEKNSLQFVEHNVEEKIEGNTIIINFNVFEGEKITVERVNIIGNNVTNENVIRSELELDEGDPFTQLSLDKSIANLKSRNIFGEVKAEVVEGSAKNLRVIEINVEEKPTGELAAGAGVGTNGGTIGFNIKENNWLGEGKKIGFDMELDQESLRGTISYTNPNYDFLGNSLSYSLSSITNDKPNQGYENSLISADVSTTFEQFQDVYATLGLSASFDDLTTDDTASNLYKNKAVSLLRYQEFMVLFSIKEIELLCLQMDLFYLLTNHFLSMLIKVLYQIQLHIVLTKL